MGASKNCCAEHQHCQTHGADHLDPCCRRVLSLSLPSHTFEIEAMCSIKSFHSSSSSECCSPPRSPGVCVCSVRSFGRLRGKRIFVLTTVEGEGTLVQEENAFFIIIASIFFFPLS